MTEGNDALIQTASGLWIPKQIRVQREQHAQQPQQKVQQHPEPMRDWKAHWKEQGQPWRREPEIDQVRQQFLQQRLEIEPDAMRDIFPFKEIVLTRADLEWLIQEHKEKSVGDEKQPQGLNLAKAILETVDCSHLPLDGANFANSKLEGAHFGAAKLKGAHFRFAKLEGADFRYAELEGIDFRYTELKGAHFEDAELKGAHFEDAELKGAHFGAAKLEGAHFGAAKLEGADFECTELKGAHFEGTELKGAEFGGAKLEGADFRYAELEGANFGFAKLKGADFRETRIANAFFKGATIVTAQGFGPMVADVTGWDEISLPIREWSEVKRLGDEAIAKERRDSQGNVKDATTRFNDYFAATRAYRQVTTAVEGMGRKEEAEKFAFRAQVMQRKMHWWSIWQGERSIWQRLGDFRAWMFSGLLALLSGYGYRFERSLSWYLGVLLAFAWLYVHLSQNVPPHSSIPDHLSWFDACILSVSDMVGRGFFRQDVQLSDPYAGWSVLEGMIGVFMDVVLISTLTQRLFKK